MVYRGSNVPAEDNPPDIHEAPQPDPEKARRKRLRNIAIAVVIVIAIVAYAIVRSRSAANQKAAQAAAMAKGRPVPVGVAPVQLRDVPVDLEGLGNVIALNTVTVKTRIDGQLVRFNFREGQEVHAGEELALIDPRPSEAQLAQAEAAKFKDEASLENARRDLERYAALYKTGVIPQQQYNTQQSQVGVDLGTVQADEAQIEQAKLNVSYCHITSPINGRVGIRFVDPGNMVHATDPNGLVVITQMQPIAVLFTLPEDDIQAVVQHMHGGTPLVVEAWSRDGTQLLARGSLLTIDNEIDPNTGTFRIKAIFPNKDGALFPNQFVNSKLQIEILHGAVTIPAAAIQHGAIGTYVYVVLPNKTVDAQQISVAMTQGTIAVVSSGLRAGQLVVTDGADKLQPHAKVQIAGGGRGGGAGQGQATDSGPSL